VSDRATILVLAFSVASIAWSIYAVRHWGRPNQHGALAMHNGKEGP
jgi:hypothetical protein